jgi:hypothetical protein
VIHGPDRHEALATCGSFHIYKPEDADLPEREIGKTVWDLLEGVWGSVANSYAFF